MDQDHEEQGIEYVEIAEIPSVMNRRSTWLWVTIVSGIGVIASPVIGLLTSIFGMRKAFMQVGSSGSGSPSELSGQISTVLGASALGLLVSGFLILVVIGSLIRYFTLPKEV